MQTWQHFLITKSSFSMQTLKKVGMNRLLLLANPSPKPNTLASFPETCLHLLSHCNSNSLTHGLATHSPIIKLGLHFHLHTTNTLLSLYSKCLGPSSARNLFDEMPQRDIVSWTAIVSAYAQHGDPEEALELFRRMLESGLAPNQFTYSSVIRCASSLKDLDLGAGVHAQMTKRGFDSNAVLASGMLDFYSKCGLAEEGCRVFGLMGCRDTVFWTTGISAFVQAEDWVGALRMYTSMVGSGVSPNEFTFAKLSTVCGFLGLPRCGQMVHAHIVVWGVGLNLVLKTALVDMYCKCGKMRDAEKVLQLTPECDVMLLTAMVSGYNKAEDYREAIKTFRGMDKSKIKLNSFMYAAILNTCTGAARLELGMQIHSQVLRAGLEHDVSVGNGLVDLYAKLSPDSEEAVHAFGAIFSPNVISWTALIAGFSRHGRIRDVIASFSQMRVSGVIPNSFTLSTVLKGCGSSVEALAHAMKIHAFLVKTKLDASDADLVIGNSLVDSYARVGRAREAWIVANTMMPWKDIFTYTSLAKGLNQMGLHHEALDIIAQMLQDENVRMDGFSLATTLSALAGVTAIQLGKQMHCFSVKSGLNGWLSVSNGLVDMYGKCGSIAESRMAFMMIPEPNVVSWNGLISGLASNGKFQNALSAFEDMRLAGVSPDGVTMLVVLYACSHAGLVDMGVEYFNSMRDMYGMTPEVDHYVCLVDLLGRAGRLEEAACAIETMDLKPEDPLIYKTLLNCCKLHGNLVLGECMARRALEMDPSDSAVYVLLAGIYDDAGKTEFGEQVRRMMRERRVNKCPGESWMETRNW